MLKNIRLRLIVNNRAAGFYPDIHGRGLSIIGAHADIRPRRDRLRHFWPWRPDCELVMQLMAADRLKVAPILSTIYPWRQAAAAYESLRPNDGMKMGLLIDWGPR